MTTLVEKLVAEEHHLEELATLPMGGIVLALVGIVGLALGVTLAVYYIS